MTEIALDHVGKRFDDGTVAVRDVSFEIRDGEFFILVGPSGCGKSTLLGMIVGLTAPTEGEIRVDGKRVNEVDARDRNMAMVFQSYALYPHMTVRENLAFPLSVAGLDRAEIESRVERAAAILELEALLDRRPASLSGGQRQRAAMGRAIVREPAAFLLDEPLSNLDARLRVQMRTEIARLQKRLGTTTIYVTHDQAEALTLGDRVAVLRGGVVQQVGTPRELYEAPANLFVAGFIGAPAMNFLPARAANGRLVLPMLEMPLPGALIETPIAHEGPLIAGIRPEHLKEAPVDTAAFRARVDVAEWLGAEMYLHFAIDAGEFSAELPNVAVPRDTDGRVPLVARVDAASRAAEDLEIGLALDADHVQLFDAVSGRRLGPEVQRS
jgi:multiple sugar transport system ATP-binding protein